MSEVEATERQALLQKVRDLFIIPHYNPPLLCGTGARYVLCKAPGESRLRLLQGNVLNFDET